MLQTVKFCFQTRKKETSISKLPQGNILLPLWAYTGADEIQQFQSITY